MLEGTYLSWVLEVAPSRCNYESELQAQSGRGDTSLWDAAICCSPDRRRQSSLQLVTGWTLNLGERSRARVNDGLVVYALRHRSRADCNFRSAKVGVRRDTDHCNSVPLVHRLTKVVDVTLTVRRMAVCSTLQDERSPDPYESHPLSRRRLKSM